MTGADLVKLGLSEEQAASLIRNGQYWKTRFGQVEQAQHDRGAKAFRKIEDQYRKAQKDLEAKISAWYQRFADNNGITLQEARKMLDAKQLAEFRWDVNEYIKYGKENALNGQWVKELENASARFHISRLEALKIQCQQDVEVLFGSYADTFDHAMRDIYKSGYYENAFTFQKGLGVGWDFSGLDPNHINKVLNTPWAVDGRNFTERIWGSKDKLINEMDQTLTQNIILGKDPQKAIDTIAAKMDVSKAQAGRLVMTEEAYFSSLAQKDCFKELDVDSYEIVATLDSITSDICRDMDGKVFKMSQWETGVTAPPFHPWCRTTTVPAFEDDFGLIGERAAKDDKGKTYYVPANMTYHEWEKAFVKAAPIDGIREPVDIKFRTSIKGCKAVEGGFNVLDAGMKNGQGLKVITLNKLNITEWYELPAETQYQLQYSPMDKKAFRLPKGDYEVQRYVEGSFENAERDEIAKELDGEYVGFTFFRKNNQSFFIDFYQKDGKLLYSVGKADVNRTISNESLKALESVVAERERKIIETIGETCLKDISTRNGDDWVNAMKEFHHAIQADGLPTILSDAEYNAIQSPVLYRGIAPQSRLRSDITTTMNTREMADEFFTNAIPFPSRGVYGDGVAYASPSYKKIAWNYATNGGAQLHGGVIIEFKLKPDARLITYEDALAVFRKMSKNPNNRLLFNPKQHNAFDREVGKAMNSLGYDAIIKHNGDNTGKDFYVILNRSALATKKKYITTMLK